MLFCSAASPFPYLLESMAFKVARSGLPHNVDFTMYGLSSPTPGDYQGPPPGLPTALAPTNVDAFRFGRQRMRHTSDHYL